MLVASSSDSDDQNAASTPSTLLRVLRRRLWEPAGEAWLRQVAQLCPSSTTVKNHACGRWCWALPGWGWLVFLQDSAVLCARSIHVWHVRQRWLGYSWHPERNTFQSFQRWAVCPCLCAPFWIATVPWDPGPEGSCVQEAPGGTLALPLVRGETLCSYLPVQASVCSPLAVKIMLLLGRVWVQWEIIKTVCQYL